MIKESIASLLLLLVMLAATLTAQAQEAQAFKREELEQLVAPIALYPDSLVAQILMASAYPLEVVEAARWARANPNVKDMALEDAMQQQSWDPSVKSLTAFPQVLAMMNDKLDMVQKLGDAFLAQQKDVLAAIQALRAKAQAAGNLESGKEQTVSSAQEGGTTVIKIEPAQPATVYVPVYDPAVVYGPWPYAAYPPYAYYPPGYVAGAAAFSFTAGVIVGAALWGDCDWRRGDVNINVNRYNSFNRTSIQSSSWSHNSVHRKGVQYRDAASRQRFGQAQRGDAQAREAFRGRAEQGRQEIAHGGADRFKGPAGARPGGPAERSGAAGDRTTWPGEKGAGQRAGGAESGGARLGERGSGERAGGERAGGERAGGGLQRAGAQPGAFEGLGDGRATRSASNRGASSRAAAGRGGGLHGRR